MRSKARALLILTLVVIALSAGYRAEQPPTVCSATDTDNIAAIQADAHPVVAYHGMGVGRPTLSRASLYFYSGVR